MPAENLPVNEKLLGRYLAGAYCSPEELTVIKQYFTDDRYAEEVRQIMAAEWNYLHLAAPSGKDMSGHYQRFIEKKVLPYKMKGTHTLWRRSLKYAAIVLLLGGAIKVWMNLLHPEKKQELAMQNWLEKANPRGQHSRISMPDGSVILLGPESRVSYLENYGTGQRLIRLQGEAFFQVVHDSNCPFIVETGDVQTVDIGTAFNIRAYPEERRMMVAVKEGTVDVRGRDVGDTTRRMIAGQTLTYVQDQHYWQRKDVDTGAIGNWTRGIFEFENESLENVLAVIGRHYNFNYTWKDNSLRYKKLTIQFKKDDRDAALKWLEMTAGARFLNRGGRIEICR